MMTARLFNFDKDYQTVTKWWTERNHIQIKKDFLSDYGVMVSKDGKDLAAMWLYPMITTAYCMVRFPITNPETTKLERNEALDLVFANLHGMTKDLGYKYLFCTTNHPSLIKRLEKYQYTKDAENCVHFWVGV
jgi:hypothetical protein